LTVGRLRAAVSHIKAEEDDSP